MRSLPAVLSCIAALLLAAPAIAAEFKKIDSKDKKTRVDLVGEIVEGDADRFKAIVKEANDAQRIVVTIRLNSIGGNLLESVRIAEVVKFGRIATAVLSNSTCASACFIIFAAGQEKYAHYTARVGVHGASDERGEETIQSGAATVKMGRVVQGLGVPAAIVGKMVVTPPSEMVWLSVDELRAMNVAMLGKPVQVPPEQVGKPLQLPPDSQIGQPQTRPAGPNLQTAAPAASAAIDAMMRTMIGTVKVRATPTFAGGELNGCTLEYAALAQDWAYRQGSYFKVVGSFGVMTGGPSKTMGVVLKVVLLDFDPRTMEFVAGAAPASAYFVSGDSTTRNAVVGEVPSDTPGGIFVILKTDPTFKVMLDGLNRDKVPVAFARRKGGSDIRIDIDTTVVETGDDGKRVRSPKISLDFLSCVKSLLQ
jgi:hypothetical protein